MRRSRTLILTAAAAIVLVGFAGARATTNLLAQPSVVGVVDVQAVFESLSEKRDLEADLRSRAEQLDEQQQAKRQEVASLRADLDLLAPGSDAYAQKRDQVEEQLIELQVWTNVEQQKINRERGLLVENLYRKTLDAVGQVAADGGYDLVLFKESSPEFRYENPQQLSTLIQVRKVLWSADELDLTSQVIQRMNNTYENNR